MNRGGAEVGEGRGVAGEVEERNHEEHEGHEELRKTLSMSAGGGQRELIDDFRFLIFEVRSVMGLVRSPTVAQISRSASREIVPISRRRVRGERRARSAGREPWPQGSGN
jgi:hypothetical protein